jgi:hypothetical protein
MITCKSFGNVFADAILYEPTWGTKPCVFLSLVGSESTVKGASAAFLENHPLYFMPSNDQIEKLKEGLKNLYGKIPTWEWESKCRYLQSIKEVFAVRRDARFDAYRSKSRRLAPHIIHAIIYPLDFSSHIVVGRDERELKSRLASKVMDEIPFLSEWGEWLWKWCMDTRSFEWLESLTGNILGGWVRIDYETLKSAISANIGELREQIP